MFLSFRARSGLPSEGRAVRIHEMQSLPLGNSVRFRRCDLQLKRPSILGRLEDTVLEVVAALDVRARVVPLAAALVAGAVLPLEAEGRP